MNPINHQFGNRKQIISQLYNDGFGLRDIADTLEISHMTVYRSLRR